ncbi:hypothetical protein [Candidatus Borrarchaeum sp.]|uniref:hypothetical protein n=1 Tax=Candidatus Borrarchaeum sp. TaxID=2846742 RepID=UPI00257CC4D3|nr:hypothetical protein [Candidatus Borrarchaeum sp.]
MTENIKTKLIIELKYILTEIKSLLLLLLDLSKRYKFSTLLLLIWIVSIPLLFYFFNIGVEISNELLLIELPVVFSWGPILLCFYHGLICSVDE